MTPRSSSKGLWKTGFVWKFVGTCTIERLFWEKEQWHSTKCPVTGHESGLPDLPRDTGWFWWLGLRRNTLDRHAWGPLGTGATCDSIRVKKNQHWPRKGLCMEQRCRRKMASKFFISENLDSVSLTTVDITMYINLNQTKLGLNSAFAFNMVWPSMNYLTFISPGLLICTILPAWVLLGISSEVIHITCLPAHQNAQPKQNNSLKIHKW